MKNLKKGFTLIELMIVVAIIAILAVVAAPKFGQQLKKAKDSQAVSLVGTYRSALTMHAADNEAVYATSFSALQKYVDSKTITTSYDSNGANALTATTFASQTTSISAMVGTSSTSASNKPYAQFGIQGDTTETNIVFATGAGKDTKQTTWSAY